jgi:hypothetical protein
MLSERFCFQKHIEFLYRLLLFKIAVGDDDDKDDDVTTCPSVVAIRIRHNHL